MRKLTKQESNQLVVYDTRKEQPSIWNLQAFAIVFLFIMLSTTINVYSVNNDNLTWIDSNGDFKINSYDHSMINLNTPIVELNNQSLNDVFNQGNEAPNSTFDNNINGWLTTFANGYETWENGKVKLDNTSGLGYANIYTNASINNAYYINFDLEIIIGELKVESTGANTYEIFTSLQNGNNSLLVSSLLNSNISFARNVNPSIFYLDNIYLIDLTSLGIDNLTKNQMDEYYNLYVNLQENRIEAYKDLGNEPISQWQNLTQVLSDIMDAVAGPITDTIDWIDKFMFGLFS